MVREVKLKCRIPKICNDCKTDYLARQANSKRCDDCRKIIDQKNPCKCGCGKLVRGGRSGYASGCFYRGRRNEGNRARCGFKKGAENPNYDPVIKKKAIESLVKFYRENPDKTQIKAEKTQQTKQERGVNCFKFKYSNTRDEKFRSSLELNFAELLYQNNFSYKTEQFVNLNNGKRKIVDFIIDDSIYVEVTGYAYGAWQNDFDEKLRVLRETIDNPIILLTYPDKIDLLMEQNHYQDVHIANVKDEARILKSIKFAKQLLLIKQICNEIPIN